MKKFFKLISLVLCLYLVTAVALTACGSSSKTQSSKINIVATNFPPYDFSRQIAGDNANVTMLLSPGAESHSYEPTPKDIVKIEESDVFVYIGGESDTWVENILSSIDTSKTTVVKLMDCVEPLQEETTDNTQSDTVEYDEHIWTSPKNAQKMVQTICDAVCKADESHKSDYEANTKNYIADLAALDKEFSDIVKTAKKDTVVFGDRFPFAYFTKEYGLKHFAAFPGCSSETEPSAATMAKLITEVKENNLSVVFYVEMSNQKVADTICESTGAKKLLFHSCHNVSKDEMESGATYLSLMKQNAENLKTALN